MTSPRALSSSPASATTIRRAKGAGDLEDARRLFREYRQWHIDHRELTKMDDTSLQVGLGYLDAEIASLPGQYAPPRGALLLAYQGDTAVGCGGLRPLGDTLGEIKRVYVQPASRGGGLGAGITRALLAAARASGYDRVVLDTLPGMSAAIAVYRKLGFVPTTAYGTHPTAEALFFEYRLRDPSSLRPSRSP